MLVFAATASALTAEWADAGIVLAVAALQARTVSRVQVLRDDRIDEVPINEIVPGDVVVLSAGSLVPAGHCWY